MKRHDFPSSPRVQGGHKLSNTLSFRVPVAPRHKIQRKKCKSPRAPIKCRLERWLFPVRSREFTGKFRGNHRQDPGNPRELPGRAPGRQKHWSCGSPPLRAQRQHTLVNKHGFRQSSPKASRQEFCEETCFFFEFPLWRRESKALRKH